MNESKQCIRCLVTGKVQGVWFRAGTKNKAQALGVLGWVRNVPTGQVEVQACGEESVLTEFTKWLHEGPERASVEKVDIQKVPCETFTKFEVVS